MENMEIGDLIHVELYGLNSLVTDCFGYNSG